MLYIYIYEGINHDELVALANTSFGSVDAGDTAATPAKYFGGFESRIGTGVGAAHVAIGFEGIIDAHCICMHREIKRNKDSTSANLPNIFSVLYYRGCHVHSRKSSCNHNRLSVHFIQSC